MGKPRVRRYEQQEDLPSPSNVTTIVRPKTPAQHEMLKALRNSQVVVLLAPAGTGKTYLTMHVAGGLLVSHQIDKLVLTRPAVGMGKSVGLLKGDMVEKFSPYLAPLIEAFTTQYGKGRYDCALRAGSIEMLPLEYVRGRNIHGVCILDEAQNTTADEMYALLTRVAEDGKLFILGDISQTDVGGGNGLSWLFDFVDRHDLHDIVGVVTATSDDIVRGDACKRIVQAKEADTRRTK